MAKAKEQKTIIDADTTDASPETPAAPPRDSVGTLLSRARKKRGEDLVQIADTIRIRRVLLEALENDAHEQLPGGIYTIGFVRSYASYLKLDAEAIEAQWREEAEALTQRPEYSFPTPTLERRLPGIGSIIAGLAIILIPIVVGLYYIDQQNTIELGVPALPERFESLVPDLEAPEIDLPTTTPAASLTTPLSDREQPELETAPTVTVTDSTPQPGVSDDREGQSFGVEPEQARLTIRATRDVWVQVRDSADDQIVLTRVLSTNDRYHAPDRDGLLMTLGDAGAVRAEFADGLEITPGGDGAVMRDIPLNRDDLIGISR